MDVLPWLTAQETALLKAFDANDWIYQTWAYDRHDLGTTPGMNGDTIKALRAIKGKTLDWSEPRTCSTPNPSRSRRHATSATPVW
jgi:homoserine acetyltransferase